MSVRSETTGRVLALRDGLGTLSQRSADLLTVAEARHKQAIRALQRLRQRKIDSLPPDSRRVLLVDDEHSVLNALRRMILDVADFCDVAPSLKTARARIAERSYDCMILDYTLANGVATDLISAVRHKPHRRHAWIILISGHWKQEEGLRVALQLGANDYQPKPITTIEDFQRKVLRAFTHSDRPYTPLMRR